MRDYGVATKAAATPRQPKGMAESVNSTRVHTVVRPSGAAGELLRLQRQHGNRFVQQFLSVSGERGAKPSWSPAIEQARSSERSESETLHRYQFPELIQRWGPGDHKQLTTASAKQLLASFEGFTMDEAALNELARCATDMDLKIGELLFNFGGKLVPLTARQKARKLEALKKYYAQHPAREASWRRRLVLAADCRSCCRESVDAAAVRRASE